MFSKIFKTKINDHSDQSIDTEKKQKYQRKRKVLNEFTQSVINLQLEHGIWTPLHIVDFLEMPLSKKDNSKQMIESHLDRSFEIHKNNLSQKLYRRSFNFQPSYILIVVKDKNGNIKVTFKNSDEAIEKVTKILDYNQHRILLVRYFIPPIPDDLYKFDDIALPSKFEEAMKDIVNYCKLNYSLQNLTLDKWQKIISSLGDSGVVLHLPGDEQKVKLSEFLTEDYSDFSYKKVSVEQTLKDTVEKNTIIVPLFILLLALFCSKPTETNSFYYHYLFTPAGSVKEYSMNRGLISFQKLFNKLLNESLQPEQFQKCLNIIFRESFRMHQFQIDDLLFELREKYRN